MVMFVCEDYALHYVYLNTISSSHTVSSSPRSTSTPSAPLVVLIHGLFIGNLASWYSGIGIKLSQRYPVLMYDLRGHGRSSCPPNGYTLMDMLQDLYKLLQHIGWQQKPIVLAGHSYGGLIALQWAYIYPQWTHSIALLDIPFPPQHIQDHWQGWFKLEQHLPNKDKEHSTSITHQSLIPSPLLSKDLQSLWYSLPPTIQAILQHSPRRAKKLLTRWFQLYQSTTLLQDMLQEDVLHQGMLHQINCPVLTIFGSLSDCLSSQVILKNTYPLGQHHLINQAGHFLLNEASDQVYVRLESFLETIKVNHA
jgi:pimeloyl-ACP methyl ester carboxylesterase